VAYGDAVSTGSREFLLQLLTTVCGTRPTFSEAGQRQAAPEG